MPRLTLLLAATATAHFTINLPPQKSPSSEASLATGPCGGASLSFDSPDSITDFHVDGDAVAVTGTHPQANWLIRATNDTSGEEGWMAIWQIVRQGGLGKMCIEDVKVPEGWSGSEGVIGVVANAEDGILFGCSQVRFVEGTGDTPDSCTNTTSDISATEDSDLEALATSSGADAGDEDPEMEDEDGSAPGLRAGLLALGLGLVGALVL